MSGPHDLLVRYTFGNPERAAAELRAVLPAAVVSQVDWSSLRRESGSVVDTELRETQSDLLFSARVRGGRTVLFYVLLEHQSTVDRWMALRMLRYVVRRLELWRKEHPESELLPVIIPLVMHHGPHGGWTAPRRVEELFEFPEEEEELWRALVPRFEYGVDDLTSQREEALLARPGPALAVLTVLALRYGGSEELAQRLPGWGRLFAWMYAGPGGEEDLRMLYRYFMRVGDRAAKQSAVDMLRSMLGTRRAEELMGTWGEDLIEQGRQEGLARGRAEAVLRILAVRKVPVDDVARQRILSCMNLATLDVWFDRALNATRLSEVLDERAQ
jgi:hypothetical protein